MYKFNIYVLTRGLVPEFPLFVQNQELIIVVFIVFIFPLTSSAFLEETGFRGYALPLLQQKYRPLVGTLIIGTFFGAWLLPEFFLEGSAQMSMGIGFYPFFIITEIAWSVIMTWIFNKTNESALVSGWLFHAFFNAWTMLLLTNAIPGETFPMFDVQLLLVNALVLCVVASILILTTRGKLGLSNN